MVNKSRILPQADARLSKCISKLKLRRKRLAQSEVSSLQADEISTIPTSVSGAQAAGVTVITFQVRLPVLCVFVIDFFRDGTFPMRIIIQAGRMSFLPFPQKFFWFYLVLFLSQTADIESPPATVVTCLASEGRPDSVSLITLMWRSVRSIMNDSFP